MTAVSYLSQEYRKNDLILIMTPEKQDKTLELSKHWSVESTPVRNELIMKVKLLHGDVDSYEILWNIVESMFCEHCNYIETRPRCKHGIYIPFWDGPQGSAIFMPGSHISQQLKTAR